MIPSSCLSFIFGTKIPKIRWTNGCFFSIKYLNNKITEYKHPDGFPVAT